MTRRARNKSPHRKSRTRRYAQPNGKVIERIVEVVVEKPAIATGLNPPEEGQEQEASESFFWPELQPATIEAATAAGRGSSVKQLQDVRIELEAVKKNYNIPESIKARMVYEAARAMVYSKVLKEKFWAIKLLKEMEDANNRPSLLPTQVTVNNHNTLSVNALLQQFGKDLMDPSMDLREVVVVPGAPGDYAD
jgi:hypothetical protein